MDPRSSAHKAHGHRHLNASHKVSVPVFLIAGQRSVLPSHRSIRMGSGFHSAGIVSCCQNNRGHAVHDALVVSCGPVGIDLRELCRQENSVYHLVTSNLFCLEDRASPGQAQVSKIGYDSQIHPTTCNLLDSGGQRLGHGVDCIGAHRISAVHYEVGDDHRSQPGVDDLDLDILDASAEPDEHWVLVVGHLHQLTLVMQYGLASGIGIDDSGGLDLGAHDGPRAGGDKSASFSGHPGSVAGGSND